MSAAAQHAVAWDGVQRGYIPADPPRVDPSVALHRPLETPVDAVTYEVVRYALMNLNLEHADLIQRLSLSPVVMFARDFQTSLLTEVGDVVFLGAGVQYFSSQNALTVKYILEHRAGEGLADGDMFLCNDPLIGASHQSDVSLCAPVFVGDELFCWLTNSLHYQDVGGQIPGSQCVGAEDAFQEPASWPPVRFVETGRIRSDLESLFVRQSRFPALARMDLRAGIGAISATRGRVAALVERYGADVVKTVMHRVLDAGEQLFVDRLAGIPDGRWSHRATIEAALPGDRSTYSLQVNVTKAGDRLTVDNAGTDPQAGAINLTYAGFSGCVQAALTQQLLPEQAGAYGGAHRRIGFEPVPGLLNCADHPAAVSSSGVFATEAMMNTAATAVCKMLGSGDDEIQALSLGAPTANLSLVMGAGVDARGEQFMLVDPNGLIGSLAGRATRDGVDSGGHWWIPDAIALNSEDLEAQTPYLVLARELLPSGADGAGRHRAGVGFRELLAAHGVAASQIVNYQNEGFPRGQGLFGGNPGSLATCRIKHRTDLAASLAAGALPTSIDEVGGDEGALVFKGAPVAMADFDVLEWTSPGAAGYGDPLRRDPRAVLVDACALMISPTDAARVYGVVIASCAGQDPQLDLAATDELRRERRRERLGGREPGGPVEPPDGARRIGEMLCVVAGRWWCNGLDLGPATGSYKHEALTRDTPVRQLGPEYESADHEMADRFVLREYLCPATGFRIDAELMRTDFDPLEDITFEPVS